MNSCPTKSAPREVAQLRLLGNEGGWRIDDHTKRIGREGLAKARAELAAHPSPIERVASRAA